MGNARLHGQAGEALAAAYLELIGCTVVARNTRLGGVEVDLVVDDGGTKVLIEVKTRTRTDYGGAAMAVDHAKRARLLRAARTLGSESSGAVRIDVVTVEPSEDGAALRHYRNAVTAGG